ncbi:hypothetical protein [Corynebacterium ulceribovis]|uniref:hypothetical protein n=1 Tax=Corynebacterium ulceribovis TaxID=487732 RepID=UPI0003A4A9D1|nr:hypothetical protein [Corynebacterium ulceribovis]
MALADGVASAVAAVSTAVAARTVLALVAAAASAGGAALLAAPLGLAALLRFDPARPRQLPTFPFADLAADLPAEQKSAAHYRCA